MMKMATSGKLICLAALLTVLVFNIGGCGIFDSGDPGSSQQSQSQTSSNQQSSSQQAQNQTGDSSASQKAVQPAFNQPQLPAPATSVLYNNVGEGDCPNAITTQAGGGDYLIKMYASSGALALTAYIRNGETLEFNLPPDDYTLKYAAGYKWYGEPYYFGPDTEYGASADKLSCYYDGNYACGNTVTLYPVANGNMETHDIDKSAFEKGQ